MAETDGTNGHARPRLSEAELAVLELLPRCSAAFLGHLKLYEIPRAQRELRGVRASQVPPEPDPGRVAGRPGA